MKSVERLAKNNGYDSWIMMNVYPQRATDPSELDAEINNDNRIKNSGAIRQSIKHLGIDTIWVAYGDLIEKRNYLPYCLADLFMKLSDLNLNWKIIKNTTKKGHPRHPLYRFPILRGKLFKPDSTNMPAFTCFFLTSFIQVIRPSEHQITSCLATNFLGVWQ